MKTKERIAELERRIAELEARPLAPAVGAPIFIVVSAPVVPAQPQPWGPWGPVITCEHPDDRSGSLPSGMDLPAARWEDYET